MILTKYFHVVFRDNDFDFSVADFVKNLPQCVVFMGLPFTIHFKDDSVVAATTSIQTKDQIVEILEQVFGKQS